MEVMNELSDNIFLEKIIKDIDSFLMDKSINKRIEVLNKLKMLLHKTSPFKNEPVDCVVWLPVEQIYANDYNPNKVAPPEMKLLEHSIREDGYTQPIVTWNSENELNQKEVVDGFHRNRVAREIDDIKERLHGYVPIVVLNADREDRGDRISSTIRHNRARGKHQVQQMSEIVIELKRRNWSDKKIAKNLGMDADEILRLTQITGLAEMFKDKKFSEAWEAVSINENDNLNIDGEIE